MPNGAIPEPTERNPEAVRAMFGRLARRYDLANHLLSGGADFWWRRQAAAVVRQWQPRRLLDLATGSGDLALAIARQLPDTKITAADFSPEMLAIASAKGLAHTVVADALDLPFRDQSFDAITVAFGLRNMADYDAALQEMSRVLTPNGHLLLLDFSMPRGWLCRLYRTYLHRCLPMVARLLTGERESYEYLGASIEKFPSGQVMCELIRRNGFRIATARPLSLGIVSLYTASK